MGEAAPHASGTTGVLGIGEQVVHEGAVRVAIGLELVRANMDGGLGIKDGVFARGVLVPDGERKGEGVVVLVAKEVEVVVAAARGRGGSTQVGAHLGERQRVGRHVELGDHVHAHGAGVRDELAELVLGVEDVRRGEVGLVEATVAACLDV